MRLYIQVHVYTYFQAAYYSQNYLWQHIELDPVISIPKLSSSITSMHVRCNDWGLSYLDVVDGSHVCINIYTSVHTYGVSTYLLCVHQGLTLIHAHAHKAQGCNCTRHKVVTAHIHVRTYIYMHMYTQIYTQQKRKLAGCAAIGQEQAECNFCYQLEQGLWNVLDYKLSHEPVKGFCTCIQLQLGMCATYVCIQLRLCCTCTISYMYIYHQFFFNNFS